MHIFYEHYLNNLIELHDEARNILNEIPQFDIDWVPGKEMNSIAVLVSHFIGAERYWLSDVIASSPSNRNREAEFLVREIPKTELLSSLKEIEDTISKILQSLKMGDLADKRISPRNGREVTVGWALSHALKHTALHVGHLQMTYQLWKESSS